MNEQLLDLTRLRVFVAVAREGSVTGAAAALNYAQPSVSHHLGRLEKEMGVPLVQRVGRGIRLTEAGRLLAERGEEILGRLGAVKAEVAAHAGLEAGRARLAAFPSALATIVPDAAARLRQEHPKVELSLVEAEPPEALRLLRNGEVEVALYFEHGTSAGESSAGLTVLKLMDDPLYVVTPERSRWASPASKLGTYAGARWIAGCERCREHLLSSCADAGFTPAIAFETDDYVAVQSLVAAGMGVSTLPALAVRAHRGTGVRFRQLDGEARRIMAATYGAAPGPLPAQALLKALRQSAQGDGTPEARVDGEEIAARRPRSNGNL